VRRDEGAAGRLMPRLLDLPPGVVDSLASRWRERGPARISLPPATGTRCRGPRRGGLREREKGEWGKEGVRENDLWVLRVGSLDEGEK
jgi:hypothetical protein